MTFFHGEPRQSERNSSGPLRAKLTAKAIARSLARKVAAKFTQFISPAAREPHPASEWEHGYGAMPFRIPSCLRRDGAALSAPNVDHGAGRASPIPGYRPHRSDCWAGEPARPNADSIVAMATNRTKSASRNRTNSSARGQKTGMGANSNKRRAGRRTSTSSKARSTSAKSGSRSGARKTMTRRRTRMTASSGGR
jgi:hypothetical protein